MGKSIWEGIKIPDETRDTRLPSVPTARNVGYPYDGMSDPAKSNEAMGTPTSFAMSSGQGMRSTPGTNGSFSGPFNGHEIPEEELVAAGKKKLDRSAEVDESAWEGIKEAFVSLADHPEEEMEPSMPTDEAELEALRAEFKEVSDRVLSALDGMDEPSMVKLIFHIDPEYAAGKFGSVGKDNLKTMYHGWHKQILGDDDED